MKEKVILITGASSGIGKETALKLISEGHKVYGGARRVEKMKDLENEGGIALKLDVTKKEDIDNAVNEIIKNEGKIDVLINNAGFGLYGSVEETPIEKAKYQYEVNVFGLAQVTKVIIPHMRKQNSGTIINISSMGGKIYMPLGAWYHSTKHAVEGFSDSLRVELKQFGINVVIIEPGAIETSFDDVMLKPLQEISGNGPYKSLADAFSNATKKTYSKGSASPASVIAKTISRAVNSDKPATRYAAGKYAKLMIFIRTYFGDKVFDFVLNQMIK